MRRIIHRRELLADDARYPGEDSGPGTRAVLRHSSISASKARQVLDLIRGDPLFEDEAAQAGDRCPADVLVDGGHLQVRGERQRAREHRAVPVADAERDRRQHQRTGDRARVGAQRAGHLAAGAHHLLEVRRLAGIGGKVRHQQQRVGGVETDAHHVKFAH